jgi:hypothetical protein
MKSEWVDLGGLLLDNVYDQACMQLMITIAKRHLVVYTLIRVRKR